MTESDGIHIYGNIPDLRVPDADCHLITDRVLVKGSSPAWGPADIRGTPAPPPPAPPPPVPPAKPDTGARANPMGGAIIAPRQRGRAVRLRVPEISAGTTVRIRLLGRRGALMGAAVRRDAKPGTLALKVPLNRRGRTAQRLRGTLWLSVEVSATTPNRSTRSETHLVTLRR